MSVTSFTSWEDAQEYLAQRIESLNDSLAPKQRAIRDTPGHQYVVALAPEGDDDLLLYGDIPPGEADLADNRANGYLTGTWYSQWEPDGEYGDNHVAIVLFSIPPTAFKLARELGWPTVSQIRATAGEPGTTEHRLAQLMAMAESSANML